MANALKQNQKYLFWGGCIAVAIAAIVCWFIGSKKLADETKSNLAEIQSKKSQVEAVANMPSHPVTATITGYEEQIARAKKSVYTAWKQLYNKQQKALQWRPVTPRFDKEIKGKTRESEINADAREDYKKNFVLNEIPRLCKIVDAAFEDQQRTDTDPGKGGNPLGVGADKSKPAPEEHKIQWADRMTIQRKFEWRETPSSLRIWYAQEDLWIYEALCKIIAEMNVEAKGAHDTAVWTIERMEIGAAAKDALAGGGPNKVEMPAAQPQDGAAGGASAAAEPGSIIKKSKRAAAAAGATPAAGAASGNSPDDDLLNDRYVDADGFSYSAAEFKNEKTAEFRRLPFHLKLGMDQRKIETLLFKLRSAPWPIEIRVVRFSTAGAPTNDENAARRAHRFAATVDISGLIYLTNPPDVNELIKPTADKTTEKSADAEPKPVEDNAPEPKPDDAKPTEPKPTDAPAEKPATGAAG